MVGRVTVFGTSALALLLGSLYVSGFFGPTEADVGGWGTYCILAGVCAFVAGLIRSKRPVLLLIEGLGFGALAVAQIIPIPLWFLFHGEMISDGTPPTPFRAHWAWSLPHILLLWWAGRVSLRAWRVLFDWDAKQESQRP